MSEENYTKGFQLTSVTCDSCKIAFLPDVPVCALTENELWQVALKLHGDLALIKTACIKPVLKITYENALIDNGIINKDVLLISTTLIN